MVVTARLCSWSPELGPRSASGQDVHLGAGSPGVLCLSFPLGSLEGLMSHSVEEGSERLCYPKLPDLPLLPPCFHVLQPWEDPMATTTCFIRPITS